MKKGILAVLLVVFLGATGTGVLMADPGKGVTPDSKPPVEIADPGKGVTPDAKIKIVADPGKGVTPDNKLYSIQA